MSMRVQFKCDLSKTHSQISRLEVDITVELYGDSRKRCGGSGKFIISFSP